MPKSSLRADRRAAQPGIARPRRQRGKGDRVSRSTARCERDSRTFSPTGMNPQITQLLLLLAACTAARAVGVFEDDVVSRPIDWGGLFRCVRACESPRTNRCQNSLGIAALC